MDDGWELLQAARARITGQPDSALSLLELALTAFRKAGDMLGEASAGLDAATALRRLGRAKEGLPHLERSLEVFRQTNHGEGIGIALLNIGLAHEHAGDPRKALAQYAIALTHERTRGDLHAQAATLNSMGRAHHDLEELEDAQGMFQAALILRQEVGDVRGEAITRAGLAAVLRDLGDPEAAVGHAEVAARLARQVADRREEGIALGELGAALLALGRRDKALQPLLDGLAAVRAVGDVTEIADKLVPVGRELVNAGRDQEAVAAFDEAAELLSALGRGEAAADAQFASEPALVRLNRRADALARCEAAHTAFGLAGDSAKEAAALVRAGELLREGGRPSPARERMERALALVREAGRVSDEAIILVDIALALEALGRFEDAIAALDRARELSRAHDLTRTECLALSTQGRSLRMLGRTEDARIVSERALELAEPLADPFTLANVRANLGRVYAAAGRVSEALECFHLALETDDAYVRSAARSSLGDLLIQQGRHEDALPHLMAAADEAEAIQASQTYGVTADSIGSVLASRGAHDEALARHELAADILRASGDLQGEGAALHNGAWSLILLDRASEAIPRVKRSLSIARELGDRVGEGTCHTTLARALATTIEHAGEALEHAEVGATVARETGSRMVMCFSLREAARALAAMGRDAEASDRLREAAATLETLRLDAGAGDFRRDVHARLRSIFPELCHVLLRQANGGSGAEAAALREEAFTVSEAARARGFLDLWVEARASVRDDIAPRLRDAEQALLDELSVTVAERNALVLAARAGSAESAASREQALTARIGELEEQLRVAEAKIRTQHPPYSALSQAKAPTVAAVQQNLVAGGGTALLEFLLGPEESHLFVVTADTYEVHRLPAADHLEPMCGELHRALAGNTGSHPHTRELYDAILGPALPTLLREGVERLVIVPDGTLHVLPWALLQDDQGDLVLDHFTVQMTPSAAVALAQVDERRSWSAAADATLLAFGDPRSDGGPPAGMSFKPLPGTAHEISTIARLFASAAPAIADTEKDPLSMAFDSEDGNVVLRTGEHATRAAFVEATRDSRAWRYIHLATHAYADATRPGLSGLVFTGHDTSKANPFLHAFELSGLDLSCDLCVLSACETGLGQLVVGEGMVGLWRAFAFAGARSLCVSLWKVDDTTTAYLMGRFYRHIVGGTDAGRALQLAQIETRKRYAGPFFWAAFAIVL
jgi:CHAT domain-containing protein